MTLRAMVLAVILAGTTAAPAAAGTVSIDAVTIPPSKYEPGLTYETMTYAARPGEANHLQASLDGGVLTVSDQAGVQAGDGCELATSTEARCAIPHSLGLLTITLGDGDDHFTSTLDARVAGGAGDDTIEARMLNGGPGDDVLRGVEVEGGTGADVIAAKTVTYASATAPVRVDLNDLTVAGQPGEGDWIDPIVEHVGGSRFADVLVGDGRANRLVGGAGDDRLEGRGGDDELIAGAGADRLLGQEGGDQLIGDGGSDRVGGGPGRDWLRGDGGADIVLGGPGRDSADGGGGPDRVDGGAGPDYVDGGGGRDRVFSRDGQLDLVRCTLLDPVDRGSLAHADTGDLVRACGRVRRPQPTRPQIVSVTQGFERRRAVRVDVGCSQDQPSCRIVVGVVIGGRIVSRRVIRLTPGDSLEPELSVPVALYRAATRNCGRLVATVLVTSREAAGRVFATRRTASLRSGTAACGPPVPGIPLTTAAW